ncbi:MAG: DUF58 domain-containing protein [Bacteroidetes bacterium]|jgi:uncharacterized protein (DUF58 family)|nr:DUF58 domain-containing protein [Bacteroidota bacterium]
MEASLTYLQPDVAAQVATMELRARLVVEGFMTGLHKSPYHGFSVEFTEHRPYTPGDEPKRIDWKAYGKTERFYIKQFEEETNLRTHIILDASGSMGFSSGKRLTKLQYASYLAAALGYLMVEQRDAVGLTIFDESVRTAITPRATRTHLKQIWKELEHAAPGRKTRTAGALHQVADALTRRGLVIILSDLLDRPDEVITAFKHFRHKGNEVIVMQVLDPLERSFAFDSDAVFRDLETREELMSQPWHIRESYQGAMREFIGRYEQECRDNAIDFVLLDTATPFDRALMEYLHRRSRWH